MAIDPQKAAEASERAAEAAERRARAERAASEYQSTGLSFQKISKDEYIKATEAAFQRKQREQEVTAELKQQTEFRKGSVKIDKELKKVSADILKANEGILGTLLKGNIAGVLQKNVAKSTLTLQEKHLSARSALNSKIETSDKLSIRQKNSLQKIGQDIEDGLVDEQEIKDRIRNIDGLSATDQLNMLGLLEKQSKSRENILDTQQEAEAAQDRLNRNTAKLVSIFATITAAAAKFAETLDKIGETFGSLTVLGNDVKESLLSSSVEATKLGGGIEDVANITNTLASNFGMGVDEASKLSSRVFDTSKAIGLSAEEGANLFGVLMQTADLSAEQAERLAEGAFQLARQAGVAPQAVLKDIAESTEVIASFTKDGGENIAEAAVQARQLGLSLNDTAKIAEGLLDFQSSIEKEVEASVLIGRQLNLQKAREAALNNDIAGAMQEVVKQVGSEEEFNRLNAIQRKALADSIGVSVAEMSKLVGQSDKLGKSGDMAGKSFRDLLGSEAISSFTQLINNVKALGATLINDLGPSIMFVVSGLTGLVSIFTSIIGVLSQIGALVPIVAAGFGFLATKSALSAVQAGVAAGAQVKLFGAKFAGSIGALGPLAIPLVGAAIAGLIGVLGKAKKVNDVKTSPGGIKYMTGPAGTFELNPKDSVIATTNKINEGAFNGATMTTTGGGSQNVNVNVAMKSTISGGDIRSVANGEQITQDSGYASLIGGALS